MKSFVLNVNNRMVLIKLDNKKYTLGYNSNNKKHDMYLCSNDQYIYFFKLKDLNFIIQKTDDEFLIDLKKENKIVLNHIKIFEKGPEILYKCNHDDLNIDFENDNIQKIYKLLKNK